MIKEEYNDLLMHLQLAPFHPKAHALVLQRYTPALPL